jgi:hypothetical protein
MNVFELFPVLDNPLFDGLSLKNWEREHALLEPWPADWRANYQTWEPKSLKTIWPTPEVEGNVRTFNDYPTVNWRPGFSQRAVDILRDILEANGELLPVRHKIGTYYFYNCRRMSNCVDLAKSKTTKLKDGIVTDTSNLVFFDDMLDDLTIFKIRTTLLEVFCTQRFVDRVEAAGLQGFVFVPVWPLPEGVTYHMERYRLCKLAEKWRPKEMPELDIKGNTVVLRLYCERKKASKKELAAAEDVLAHLERSLYNESQETSESYFGNVEGHDVVDFEIRVFLSAPDCDRLITHLKSSFRTLPWPGKFHVVKRRGEYVDSAAPEEYVPVD